MRQLINTAPVRWSPQRLNCFGTKRPWAQIPPPRRVDGRCHLDGGTPIGTSTWGNVPVGPFSPVVTMVRPVSGIKARGSELRGVL